MSQPPYSPQPQYQPQPVSSPYSTPASYPSAPAYQPLAGPGEMGVASSSDPGLNLPWYGIGMVDAVKRFFAKYATFSGRASRGEYWWLALTLGGLQLVLFLLYALFGIDWSYGAYSANGVANGFGILISVVMFILGLALIVPSLAVGVRRLHDTNKPGVWLCVGFIPFVGAIMLIVLLATDTYRGATQWDAVPAGGYAPTLQPGYTDPTTYQATGYAPAPQGFPGAAQYGTTEPFGGASAPTPQYGTTGGAMPTGQYPAAGPFTGAPPAAPGPYGAAPMGQPGPGQY